MRFKSWLFLLEAKESELFEPDPEGVHINASNDVRRLYRKNDPTRKYYFSKSSEHHNNHVLNEYLAYWLYRLYGIRVAPSAELVIDDNTDRLRVVTGAAAGKQIPGTATPAPILHKTDFRNGFFVDAFLGNWDVVGNQPRFNVFIDDENKTTRIDTGGLDYRAMGDRKGKEKFGPKVGELQTFGGIGGTPITGHGPAAFAGMTPEELKYAAKIFLNISWQQIDQTIEKVRAEVDALAATHNMPQLKQDTNEYIDYIKPILGARYDDLKSKIQTMGW